LCRSEVEGDVVLEGEEVIGIGGERDLEEGAGGGGDAAPRGEEPGVIAMDEGRLAPIGGGERGEGLRAFLLAPRAGEEKGGDLHARLRALRCGGGARSPPGRGSRNGT